MTDARQRAQVDRAIVEFGAAEPLAERRELAARPVSMTLENGALRWIRLGDVEVLRGIAFLVRDRGWGTPSPQISALNLRETAGRLPPALPGALLTTNETEIGAFGVMRIDSGR